MSDHYYLATGTASAHVSISFVIAAIDPHPDTNDAASRSGHKLPHIGMSIPDKILKAEDQLRSSILLTLLPHIMYTALPIHPHQLRCASDLSQQSTIWHAQT